MHLHDSAPPGRGIYCNRTLNMRSIKVVGYDMDYTLVHYRVHWERRAYDHLKQRLLGRGLPIEQLTFDAKLVVRGVIIDTHRGNFLKTNRFGYIKRAYHGTTLIDHARVRQQYMRRIVSLRDSRYHFMNTLFALSEGCMYAQLVDMLDAGKLGEHALGYQDLYELVRDNINAAHTEGELKTEIMRDPAKYVVLEEDTVLTLLDQKHAGKRLMLITNSEWSYTLAMMRYAFDRFMPTRQTWRDLFDVVIVAARKPHFFDNQSPLLEIVDDDGLMRPLTGALKPKHSYFGGNAVALEQHLG
ncbi:MAG TPA: HAD family hydrolase, partial [Sorangium sp.]|nr:HAD family hydrolase [Sorangium sp.]